MEEQSSRVSAAEAMRRINQAWLSGRLADLEPMLHGEIVMAFPGFSGQVQGRESLLAGFRDFCEHARVLEFREHDHHVDVAGHVAIATFRYEMVYERDGTRNRSSGRDLWVLQRTAADWVAVWRTMLDTEESGA